MVEHTPEGMKYRMCLSRKGLCLGQSMLRASLAVQLYLPPVLLNNLAVAAVVVNGVRCGNVAVSADAAVTAAATTAVLLAVLI